MKAVSKFLAGAAAVAALTAGAATPAAAQYYPGYGGYGGGLGDVITGAILNSILRGANPYGYNSYYGRNDYNLERAAVDQCARAAEQRLNAQYARYNNGYGGYNQPYGGYGYANGPIRVVQIDNVQRTRNGNMRVNGQATAGAYRGNYGSYGAYNQPYGGAQGAEYVFTCKYNRDGRISDLNVDRNRYAYRY